MKKFELPFRMFILTCLHFFLSQSLVFSQCPDPTIVIEPTPSCNLPIDLKVNPSGEYIAYKWSTGETTEKITLTTLQSLGYSVTVTCPDGTVKSVFRFVKPGNVTNTVRMQTNVLRPCLAGDEVILQVALSGPVSGVTVVTIATSTGDTIVVEQSVAPYPAANYINIPVSPTVTTTYTLVSAVNIPYGCTYTIQAPKSTTVIHVFDDPGQLPQMHGIPYFCQGGNTWLSILSPDPQPLSYSWSGPSATTPEQPFYNATAESNYYCNMQYTAECWVMLDTFVEEINPQPEIVGGPVCSGTPVLLTTTESYVDYQWSNGDSGPQITVSNPGQYRVTITDDRGCTGVGVQTISAENTPFPNINGPVSLCTGQTTANLSVNGPNINAYLWSTGESSEHIIAPGPGSYTVTVTSAGGCTETATQEIQQVTTPTVTLTSPFTFCEGTTAALVSNASSPEVNYLWSNGATTQSIPITQGGVYRITVSDLSGECKSSAFALATALPAPHPEIVPSATAICDGTAASLSVASGTTGSYLWSNASTAAAITITTGGNYTVTVTAANGCTGTDEQAITLLPPGDATAIAYQALCDRTVALTAGPGYNSYQWSTGVSSQTLQTGNLGMYTVTVSNPNGCTSTASYNVTILPSAPAPALSPVSNLCPQATITIQPSGTYTAYAWSNGSTTAAISTSTPGTFSVTVTDDSGCTGTATQLVNATAAPDPDIAGSLSICNGGATTLSVSGSYTGFLWSTGASTAAISAGASGEYTVTVTSQQGCTGTASAQVAISSFLTPNIAAAPYNCDSQVTLFAGTGYTSYLWSNGASTNAIDVDTPGDYTLTVTNAAGCSGTAIQNIQAIPSTPQLALEGAATFCENTSTQLIATPGFDIYVWNNGAFTSSININTAGTYTVTATDIYGCSKVAAITINTNAAPVPVIAQEPYACSGFLTLNAGGPYSAYAWQDGSTGATLEAYVPGDYLVTVTNAFGCTAAANYSVAAVPQRPQADIEGPNRICTGSIGFLTASFGFESYAWSDGTLNNITSVESAGTYTVTVTDLNNCTATAEIQVDLLELPTPVIIPAPYECHGAITLATGVFETYNWSNGSQTATITVETSGDYTVTVADADGCTGVATTLVNVPAAPDPNITLTPAANYSVLLEATPGFVGYAWSNGVQTAGFTTHENGTYTVTITDDQGCTGTAEVEVQLSAPPMTVTTTSDEVTCANGNDGLLDICIAGGVPPYSFTVTPNTPFNITSTPDCPGNFRADNLAPGTYEWSVTDVNGVTQSGTNTYTNPAPLFASATISGNTITGAGTGGEGPYQYSLDGLTFQTSPEFPNLPNGSYQLVVLDARGCSALTQSLTVFIVGTSDLTRNWLLQITPNPGDGHFWLNISDCETDELQLSIRDIAGRTLQQTTLNAGACHDFRHPVNMTDAPAGTYWVEVRAAAAVKVVKLVVIR